MNSWTPNHDAMSYLEIVSNVSRMLYDYRTMHDDIPDANLS